MDGKATHSSFLELFYKQLKKCKTYKEAYEVTEQTHEKLYGLRKYISYDSFRNTDKYYRKKRRK